MLGHALLYLYFPLLLSLIAPSLAVAIFNIDSSPHSSRQLSPRAPSCVSAEPANTITSRLNQLLQSGGPGYVLNLCPNTQYPIIDTIKFTAPNQEISTFGHPTDNSRATLVVNGPRSTDGTGHTTAVNGQCVDCSGCKLRNIQINGTRNGQASILGGANIEMGGPTKGQIVEFVKSYDPRSWSCLHASEGAFNCSDITIQNNDIGPCGIDQYNQWADGISVACPQSVVRNNMINTPTDGGIVIFGPEVLVENNTIWVETHALSGGINLVDIFPWNNNFTGVLVQKNNIIGGFATRIQNPKDTTKGFNDAHAMIKVGIAMGPRVWFGQRADRNISFGATIRDNQLTGGLGFAMAANGVANFTIENNILVGNTSFFGVQGSNCTKGMKPITPGAFVQIPANVSHSQVQSDFVTVQDADQLICISPPDGDFWPIGDGRIPALPPMIPTAQNKSSQGRKVGLGLGIPLGLLMAALLTFYGRRWYLRRRHRQQSGMETPPMKATSGW